MDEDTTTRQPRSADDYLEQIMAVLNVTSSVDAYNAVKTLVEMRPLVWLDTSNGLRMSPMTVRQTMQLIGALEGLQVAAKG